MNRDVLDRRVRNLLYVNGWGALSDEQRVLVIDTTECVLAAMDELTSFNPGGAIGTGPEWIEVPAGTVIRPNPGHSPSTTQEGQE